MNLHSIVSGVIGAVNPHVPAVIRVSAGYTTSEAGKRRETFTETSVTAQLQPLSGDDLKQLDGLNMQGFHQAAYINGRYTGVSRPTGQGGDLLIVNGEVWRVVQPLELWPDWCKLVITRQVADP